MFHKPPKDSGVDFDELARLTAHDRELGDELLRIFVDQSVALFEEIRAASSKTADHRAKLPMLAHTLRGSALAIGARAVARAAEDCEHRSQSREDLPIDLELHQRLERSLDEALKSIAHHLHRAGGGRR